MSSFGGVILNISGFGFAPMEVLPLEVSRSEYDAQLNSTANNASSVGPSNLSITEDPGSLTKSTFQHFAVAATLLPTAAPGVGGIPTLPWDLTQPESVQHLAPRNPPTPETVAAAGLAVPETSVQIINAQSKDVMARCMVLKATTAWVSCQLQRSKSRLTNGVHIVQVKPIAVQECSAVH
jgi:hypothetical protein